tara:strand:- start:3978 stop:5450 length:1473 start_codon:yes stop_codon:yes gene_type:complete
MNSKKNKVLRFQIGVNGRAPYLEDTSGEILSSFNAAVLGQLLTTDEDFNLQPGLLEKFDYEQSTNSFVLRLKSNLKFHNGRSVNSKDLEFSLLRGFFSSNSSFYSVYLKNIEGIDQIDPTRSLFKSGAVSGVKIVDDLTLKVRLAFPNPSFLHSLTNPFFSLVPKEEMSPNFLSWRSIPIGAGPYKVVGEGLKKGLVELELVDRTLSHAAEKVEIYTSERKGRLCDVVLSASENQDLDGLEIKFTKKPISVRSLFFNTQNPLSRNQEFRQAIQRVIDRKRIDGLLESLSASTELLPQHFWGRSGNEIVPDLSLAKKLVSQIPEDLRTKSWEAAIFAGENLSHDQRILIDALEDQFSSVGLKIKIVPNSEKFLSQESARRFVFRMEGRVTDYVDPLIMFASLREGSAYKYDHPIGERKEKFENLFRSAQAEIDFDRRIESVRRLSKYVQEEAIAVAIGETRMGFYINPKTVKSLGYQPQPLTLFIQNIELK